MIPIQENGKRTMVHDHRRSVEVEIARCPSLGFAELRTL
jgi:hypothetical protein